MLLDETVTKSMTHGSCSRGNPHSSCKVNGQCSKKYPTPFQNDIIIDVQDRPHNRERNHGRAVAKCYLYNSIVHLDNKYIAFYNPYWLQKYNCNIIVKYGNFIGSVKHLFKYVHRVFDYINILIRQQFEHDEILISMKS